MRNATTTGLTLIALALGGCMLGPNYQRPEVDTPANWRIDSPGVADLADGAWWQQFDDPVLSELVATALSENKDLLIASARIDEYAGRYGIARSALFPQAGAGYQAYRQRSTLPGTATVGDYNSYEALAAVSWEIDLWGKIRRQSEAARAQLLASEEGRRGVILTLVGSVAGSYITLRDLDRQLEIALDTARTRGESYRLFKDRYDGGIISLLELSQNKSQYDEAMATIPSIEKAIAEQENAINVLLGHNPGPIPRGRSIDQLVAPGVPQGLPSSLLERRPDLRQSEQQLVAANAQIGAAKAAFYPSISLTGAYGFASTSLSNLFESGSRLWQYGGAISQPIFTGGNLTGQLRVAEAQQQQALFAYQKAIQNAFREVNDALVGQQKIAEQLAAQTQQVNALQVYAGTARLRYDNGYTSYLEVLDAERSLFNVQLQYAQTQEARLQALINLYKAMGGGWIDQAQQQSSAAAPTATP